MNKHWFLILVFACGGSATPVEPSASTTSTSTTSTSTTSTSTTSTSTTSTAAGVFELGEMALIEKGEPWFKIHADGSTEIGYRSSDKPVAIKPGTTWSSESLPIKFKPGPRIATDGTITNDKAVVRLLENGTFVATKDGTTAPIPDIVVTEDKILFSNTPKGNVTLIAGADGTLSLSSGPDEMAGPMTLQGADTSAKRRTILAFTALTLAPTKRTSDDGVKKRDVTAPAAAP